MTWTVPSRIETERLVLRRYAAEDAEALATVAARNREHLVRYLPWARDEPQTVVQRRDYIATAAADFDAGRDHTLGMFTRDGGELIGGTGLHVRSEPVDHVEIGYWIDAKREGEGLVTEAAAALTRVALELLRVPFVGIVHAPTNSRSAAIPQRLGYERQPSCGSPTCTDGGDSVVPVEWHATTEALATEPLASTPRPEMRGADGQPIPWPA